MAVSSELTARASKLTHLFLTNKPPSESESADINHILTLVKDESMTLGEDDCLNLEDLATKCKAAISCIRRIPPELISTIFAMCIPDHLDDNRLRNTLHSTYVPWVLVRVSKLWRAIAISQPALWALIKVDLEEMVQSRNSEPPRAVLETALERSGSMPLRVFFHDSFRPTVRAQEMLSSLMAHSHRWSQLSIYISYAHLHLTNRVRGRLPLLQYLKIGAYGANTFPSFDGFAIAPMLRDLFVTDEWEALTFPWVQLTSLGGSSRVSPISRIHRSPELLRCHFHYPESSLDEPFTSIIEHKKLTHLTTNVIDLLRYIRLPSLQEINIFHSLAFGDSPETFADFFQHSGSSLKVFTWDGAVFRDPIVYKTIFQRIPNLVKLELELPLGVRRSIQTGIIIPLTNTQSWCVLPRLESVIIQCDPTEVSLTPSFDPFLDMVESRWFVGDQKDVTRLRQAKFTKLRSWDLNSPPTKQRIDTLLEQGFLLTFYEYL